MHKGLTEGGQQKEEEKEEVEQGDIRSTPDHGWILSNWGLVSRRNEGRISGEEEPRRGAINSPLLWLDFGEVKTFSAYPLFSTTG